MSDVLGKGLQDGCQRAGGIDRSTGRLSGQHAPDPYVAVCGKAHRRVTVMSGLPNG
jgi:hypothetical protein